MPRVVRDSADDRAGLTIRGVVKWEPNACVRRRIMGTGGCRHPLFASEIGVGGFDWFSESPALADGAVVRH